MRTRLPRVGEVDRGGCAAYVVPARRPGRPPRVVGEGCTVVNSADVFEFAPSEEVTAEHFHRQFDLNVLGLLLTTQEALRYLSPEGGSIINVSSVVATLAPPTASVYCATKAAGDTVTRALAK